MKSSPIVAKQWVQRSLLPVITIVGTLVALGYLMPAHYVFAAGTISPFPATHLKLWNATSNVPSNLPFAAYLPATTLSVSRRCPTTSSSRFDLVPVASRVAYAMPDYLNPDLNLGLRGYLTTTAYLGLVDYNGIFDPNAPRLQSLFQPNRYIGFTHAFQVYGWKPQSACAGNTNGCRGDPITNWPVTLVGFATTPGETVYQPYRLPDIFRGIYRSMVLYAEEQRITLAFTRDDNPGWGYVLNMEGLCVDPSLLALYRAQNSLGWRATGSLPAINNGQSLGTALNADVLVAIRDSGMYMDPRSRKDWWQP